MMTNNPDVRLTIKRQNRKSMVMRVTPEGVIVFIPKWLKPDSPEVREFIQDGLEKFDGRIPHSPPPQLTSEEAIRDMVQEWTVRIGVQPKRVRFRSMYTRWGSCSSKDNISLNRNLFYLPERLVEYVVCHELVHLQELNHSKAFWDLMSHYMPDWKARKKELDNWRYV